MGTITRGQALNTQLLKLLKLQKPALHFISFKTNTEHAIPLLVKANILPLNLLYIMHVSNLRSFPQNKIELKIFVKLSQVVIYHEMF